MVPNSSDNRDLGRYLAIGQVGIEMAVPIGIGLLLDIYLGWRPWGIIVGAVLGLTLGLVRLVRIVNKEEPTRPPSKQKPEAP
jgi:F0F1-type ATP synthase assembly protein I